MSDSTWRLCKDFKERLKPRWKNLRRQAERVAQQPPSRRASEAEYSKYLRLVNGIIDELDDLEAEITTTWDRIKASYDEWVARNPSVFSLCLRGVVKRKEKAMQEMKTAMATLRVDFEGRRRAAERYYYYRTKITTTKELHR